MASLIDTAFNLLEQAIKLEEQGERTESHSKLNAAAVHYFQACNLMKTYLTQHASGTNQQHRDKRQLLEEKISRYESRGRSLIRRVRGEAAPYILVEGKIVPSSSNSSAPSGAEPSAPPLDALSVDARPPFVSQQSLSMLPLVEAYPVSEEELRQEEQQQQQQQQLQRVNDDEEGTEESHVSKGERIKQICEQAEAAVNEAIEFDEQRTKNDLAEEKYKDAAQLFLQAIKWTGQLVRTMEKNEGYEKTKRYHEYLKDRVQHILDRVEQLQNMA